MATKRWLLRPLLFVVLGIAILSILVTVLQVTKRSGTFCALLDCSDLLFVPFPTEQPSAKWSIPGDDLYLQNQTVYPGLDDDMVPLVGFNIYCKNYDPEECSEAGRISGDYRARKSEVFKYVEDLKRKRKPGTERMLTIYSDSSLWVTQEILSPADASKCRVPVRITNNASEHSEIKVWFGDADRALVVSWIFEPFHFDSFPKRLLVGYHREADIWGTFWPKDYGRSCGYRAECLFFPEFVNYDYAMELRSQRKSLAAVFISACAQEYAGPRMKFMAEFAQYISMDSYGYACTPPDTFPMKESDVDWWKLTPKLKNPTKYQRKVAIMSTYRFSFAFENHIREDYITEKIFNGLEAGNVMVVFGANNIEYFAPAPLCWINALSFANPKVLADYILKVNSNEWLYQQFLQYKFSKDLKLNPQFLRLQNYSIWDQLGRNSAACKIADAYVDRFGYG
jgi:hypothetical protein